MRKFPLTITASLVLGGAGFFAYNGYATPLPANTLQNVQKVSIQDDWEGYSPISPITVHTVLTYQNGAWVGPVVLFVNRHVNFRGRDMLDTQQKTVSAIVPNGVMQKVFRTLRRVSVRRGAYKPAITHTDDCPHLTLTLQTPIKTTTFHSGSNTSDNTPWQVKAANADYVTKSDAPHTALLLLRPYLHENELKELENRPGEPDVPSAKHAK